MVICRADDLNRLQSRVWCNLRIVAVSFGSEGPFLARALLVFMLSCGGTSSSSMGDTVHVSDQTLVWEIVEALSDLNMELADAELPSLHRGEVLVLEDAQPGETEVRYLDSFGNLDKTGELGCFPSCSEKECGEDGCGGLCGVCAPKEVCLKGVCQGCTSNDTPKLALFKEYGNNGDDDFIKDSRLFGNERLVVVGRTENLSTNAQDGWLMTLTLEGEVVSEWFVGGAGDDELNAVSPVGTEQGFYTAGCNGGSIIDMNCQFWVSKILPSGVVEWEQMLGEKGTQNRAVFVDETDDEFVIAAGTMGATDWSEAGDAFVVKLAPDGEVVWKTQYGTEEMERVIDAALTPDGNIVLAGLASSLSSSWDEDGLLMLLSDDGVLEWERRMGPGTRAFRHVIVLGNGKIIAFGDAWTAETAGRDRWLACFDKNGNLIWEQLIERPFEDYGAILISNSQNGFFLGGGSSTSSFGAHSWWLGEANGDGALLWERMLPETGAGHVKALSVPVGPTLIAIGYGTGSSGEAKYDGIVTRWILPCE